MPELPEVETIRRDLEKSIVGLRVRDVHVRRASVVVGSQDPIALLAGHTIERVLRHGKQLAVIANSAHAPRSEERAICVHLGMTGQLLRMPQDGRLGSGEHEHVEWMLETTRSAPAGRLVFRDPRRFGGIWTFSTLDELRTTRWEGLGPDAASPGLSERLLEFKGSRRTIKAVLLDQAVVAGIGNIYADEALFNAGVRPTRRMERLTVAEVHRLAKCVCVVLEQAIRARGSTLRDYRTANGESGAFQVAHQVYGRGKLPCLRCRCLLRSGVVAQRTTVWCSECQR